ncbi:MAG TPA: TonB-dependent receptor [Candidatus Dormibacteraeota bacterium]|nr:TonB-dependent receptor [Candidatus Dormibacteraeota bacterium]
MRAVIGTGLLLVATAARAEDQPPAGSVMLPEVEVTAAPPSEAEQRAPTAFVSEIDVGSRNRALDTTADALSEAAGVQVQHFGGLGAFSTISIRGSSANQVPVYLDGVPLSQSQDQTVDLSTLPLDSLERIDVYRGTIPVGFGGGGIGGVVNLVTKPPSATPSTELKAGYGSFETRKVVATHTQEVDGFDVLGHVTYLGSKGDFTYFNDNGTPENPSDDRETTRINNQFDAVGGLARVARDLGDGLRVDGTQELFYRNQGVPGPATVQFSEPSLEELRSLTYLRLSAKGLADAVDTSGTLYGVYNFQRFFSPPQDFGPYDTNNQTGVIGGSNTGTWFTPWQQSLSWFDEVAYEQFFPYNAFNTPANGPDQTRLRLTLAAQDEARLFDERLLLVPSLRYEHLLDDFSGVDLANQPDTPPSTNNLDLFSPSFGAMLRLTPWASLRGNVGYFQRAPNFSELFGNSGTVLGNANLKPEKGLNADVGATASWTEWRWIDRALLELALFNTDYDDLIAFQAVNPEQFRPINIGKARVRGLELSAAGAALHHLGLQLNYTHQQSEDQSGDFTDGNQLPLRPDDEIFVRVETFVDWGSTYYEYTFVSSDPTTVGNFITVPSRSIHTVGASVRPYPWLAIEFQAANITNADIRDLGDFPLPGLTLFGSITVTL